MPKFKIKLTTTGRGFRIGQFKDRYNRECTIQKSSLASEDCLWLGIHDPTPDSGGRMHLTRAMAAAIIPLLQHFVDTGELDA